MHLTRLGPYEIDKPLGKGGMGSVFAAVDTTTGQRVAIKALSPHLAAAEGFRERFEAEIESLKTLRHEGIVRLFGYGEQDGVLFYSMELVDGTSLEDELKAGRRFNWREVTSIAIQLAQALKHAHDHGIVHRDIKPANILLSVASGGPPAERQPSRLSLPEDRVKLADFGIARLFGMTQLTTAGGVLGTADYMSPEQAEGRPVTPRCDQYSLGGVMYALLAGRPPFSAKNLPQMLQLQRFAQPEPVRRYAPDTPEQLERVIMQLLAKDPADRFPNTQVLARHLQAMVNALSRPAADDFALAGHTAAHGPAEAELEHSLAELPTQAESQLVQPPEPRPGNSRNSSHPLKTHDAATLAADPPASNRPSTKKVPLAQGPASAEAAARAARFTTLEEEEARRRALQQRSWPMVAAQLAAVAAVVAGVAALASYLLQPPSADDIYHTVTGHVERSENGGRADLSGIANEIDQFLARYPDDPRAAELRQYKERIELDRLERRLQREARSGTASDPARSPAEQLYLRAVNLADNSPDEAAAMLKSLVDLYGAAADDATDSQTAAVAQLAQRRLEALRAEMAQQRERQLAALEERLAAAERLSGNDADQAAAMYRAIITLHADDDWAEQPVQEARRRLAELEDER